MQLGHIWSCKQSGKILKKYTNSFLVKRNYLKSKKDHM